MGDGCFKYMIDNVNQLVQFVNHIGGAAMPLKMAGNTADAVPGIYVMTDFLCL